LSITRIPERYRPGLARIRSMREDDFVQLTSALRNCPIVARFPLLSSGVASKVKTLNNREIDDILMALFSLAPSLSEPEMLVDKTASELVDAMRASEMEDLKLPPEEEAKFKSRITTLLSIPSVNMSAKASRVRTDYPNVFYDARILSDVRPIFDKPGAKPIGEIINHTLRIDYRSHGVHKEFYVTLDAEDLNKLKRVFERAETKAASLKSLIKSSDVPDLDLPPG